MSKAAAPRGCPVHQLAVTGALVVLTRWATLTGSRPLEGCKLAGYLPPTHVSRLPRLLVEVHRPTRLAEVHLSDLFCLAPAVVLENLRVESFRP